MPKIKMNMYRFEFFIIFLCLLLSFSFSFYDSKNITPYLIVSNASKYLPELSNYSKVFVLNCYYNSSKNEFVSNNSINDSNLTNAFLLFNPDILNETIVSPFLDFINKSLKNISVRAIGLYLHKNVSINLTSFFENVSNYANFTFLFLNVSSLKDEIVNNVTSFTEIVNKTFLFLKECNDEVYEYFLKLPKEVVLGCANSKKILEILRLNEKFNEIVIPIEEYDEVEDYIRNRFINTSEQAPLVIMDEREKLVTVSRSVFSYVQPYNVIISGYTTSFLVLVENSKDLRVTFSEAMYYKKFLNYSTDTIFDVIIVNSSNISLENINYLNETLSILLVNSRNITLEGLNTKSLNLTLLNSSISLNSVVRVSYIYSRESNITFNEFHILANEKAHLDLINSTLSGRLLSIVVNSTNSFINISNSKIDSFTYIKLLKDNNLSCKKIGENCKEVRYDRGEILLDFSGESNYSKIINILVNESRIYNLGFVRMIPIFSFNESELKKFGKSYTVGVLLDKFSNVTGLKLYVLTRNESLASYYLNKNYTNVTLVYFNPSKDCGEGSLIFYYDYVLCQDFSFLTVYKNYSLQSFFEVVHKYFFGEEDAPIKLYIFTKIPNNSVVLSKNKIKINEPILVEVNTGGVGNPNVSLVLNSSVILLSNESIPVFNFSSFGVAINCNGYNIFAIGRFSSLFSVENPSVMFENCSSSIYFFGSKDKSFNLSGRIGKNVRFVGFNFVIFNLTQEGSLIIENSSLDIYNSNFANLTVVNSIVYVKFNNYTFGNTTFESSTIILNNVSNVTFRSVIFRNSDVIFRNNISNISFLSVRYFNTSNVFEEFRIGNSLVFKNVEFEGDNRLAFRIDVDDLVESYSGSPLIVFEKSLRVRDGVKMFSVKGDLSSINKLNSSLIKFKNIDVISTLPSINYFYVDRDSKRYYYLQFFNEDGTPLNIQTYELGSKKLSSSSKSSSKQSTSGGGASASSTIYETVEREVLMVPKVFVGDAEVNVSYSLRVYLYSNEESKRTKIKVFDVDGLVDYLRSKGYNVTSVCVNLKKYCEYVYSNYNLKKVDECKFCFRNFGDYGYLKLKKFTKTKLSDLVEIEVKVERTTEVREVSENITIENETTSSHTNVSSTVLENVNENVTRGFEKPSKTLQGGTKVQNTILIVCLGAILIFALYWIFLVPDYEKSIIEGRLRNRLESLRFKLYNFFVRKWK